MRGSAGWCSGRSDSLREAAASAVGVGACRLDARRRQAGSDDADGEAHRALLSPQRLPSVGYPDPFADSSAVRQRAGPGRIRDPGPR
ncbi:hypothetical protein J2W97_001927 [Paenibacillus jamilae]|nr:hypothetical protein [Paenibacillus jamilae]